MTKGELMPISVVQQGLASEWPERHPVPIEHSQLQTLCCPHALLFIALHALADLYQSFIAIFGIFFFPAQLS
jgi:hypothetical protein